MSYKIRCTKCEKPTTDFLSYRCSCSSPLEILTNIEFDQEKIRKNDYSLWRYLKFFPYLNESEIVTLGEGWTPLVKFKKNLCLKLDFLNPTGSFKDRGSTLLISAVQRPIKMAKGYVSEDSSGNAGASIAAYAASAGLKAEIFVPAMVSGQKYNQMLFYGAAVKRVEGKRSRVAEEAQGRKRGKVYIGHIWHPIFRDGIRSLTYEIAEQLGWELPNRIYLPVSAGTLLLGVITGLEHLVKSGVANEFPTVVACQTEQVSPLYHRLKDLHYSPPKKITSIADALVSVKPPLLELMVRKMHEIKGEAEIVSEKHIFEAFSELARNGYFVEPSSAVAYAAYKKHLETGETSQKETCVIVLTGTGLKIILSPRMAN